MFIRLLGLFCFMAFAVGAFAQTAEVGIPFIRYFSAKTYGASASNYDIIQDERGLIYVANDKGILEYDGREWRKVKDLYLQALSLGKDAKGRIYVGGMAKFGMVHPDSNGHLRYKPLETLLPKENRDFLNVWSIQVTDEGVFFQSDNSIFHYQPENKSFRVLKAPKGGSYFLTYQIRQRLYVHVKDVGLHIFRGDSLALLHNGDLMAKKDIMSVLPYGENGFLICTRSEGLWLFDGKDFKPFETPAGKYIAGNELYKACVLDADHYVLGTRFGGIVIMHRSGFIKQIINLEKPYTKTVECLSVDRLGGIWAGNSQGLIRIESPLYLTLHSTNQLISELPGTGLLGTPNAITSFGGRIYVATIQGLFVTHAESGALGAVNRFKNISLVQGNYNRLVKVKDRLLVASDNNAVYDIQGENLIPVFYGSVKNIAPSAGNGGRLMIGTEKGLHFLELTGNTWRETGQMPDFPHQADEITEDQDGTIWVCSQQQGIYCFSPKNKEIKVTKDAPQNLNYQKTFYNEKNGLPFVAKNRLFSIQGKTYVYIDPKGLHRFDDTKKAFVPDTSFGKSLGDGTHEVFSVFTDSENNSWFVTQEFDGKKNIKIYKSTLVNGHYRTELQNFTRFLDFVPNGIYVRSDGVLWLCGDPGVLRVNLKARAPQAPTLKTLVRRFWLYQNTMTEDERLTHGIKFNGAFWNIEGDLQPAQTSENIKSYPYRKSNRIRLEWSVPSFDAEEKIEYQYYLEGLEYDWSPWTKETFRDYTNLDAHGFAKTYILHVRSRDANGTVGAEATYAFIIEPPYYQNIWSYIFYAVSGLVLILLVIKWNGQRLARDNRNLTLKIQEATSEITSQKEVVERANAQLNQRTEELEQSQKRLSLQNEELENINQRLSAQNDEIKRQNEEISRQKDQLDDSFHTIQDQLNTIVTQQDQLVQSQKMAALGEITPIVAHEINTPLGAIKGGVQIISTSLTPILKKIPELMTQLDADSLAQFWAFLEVLKSPSETLSTKEERAYIRKLESALENEDVPNADEIAGSLVKIGFLSDFQPYLSFIRKMAENAPLAEEVYQIGTLWKQINTMNFAADKAQQKIKALQFYVGNASAGERTLVPVSVAETIGAVLTLYDFYISQGTEVSQEIDPSVTVWAYPQEIIQVWTNLIMSAVYAMNKKGKLTVSVQKEGNNAVITFADTGTPLTPEELAHLFDAGANSRGTQPAISLAICKIRTEEYGGTLTVAVTEDQNIMRLELPLVLSE